MTLYFLNLPIFPQYNNKLMQLELALELYSIVRGKQSLIWRFNGYHCENFVPIKTRDFSWEKSHRITYTVP